MPYINTGMGYVTKRIRRKNEIAGEDVTLGNHDLLNIIALVNIIHTCHTTTRVGTLIVATIYLQLIQNRYMFQSFTVLECSHQHCVQPVASDVEVVGYL